MMNADETLEAAKGIPYPTGGSGKERVAALPPFFAAHEAINAEFREWLANEYASDLSTVIQDHAWQQAWNNCQNLDCFDAKGRYEGYHDIESQYIALIDFATVVLKAGG